MRNAPVWPVLDRIDAAILGELQNDARIANKELARRVGLAESSCLQRVRRLTETGVIRGFHAEVDLKAVGSALQALVSVRLARHTRAAVEAFRDHAIGLRETVAVFHVAGADDFLVHVAVRDSDELRDLILRTFTSWQEVAHVETSLIYEHLRSPRQVTPPGP